MSKSSIPLSFRLARPGDTTLIARLCRRAAGRGDYVIRILPEVIGDRSLFLAWSDGELVGITNLNKSIDGSGWLSMARTDPKWQRKGIALSLQQYVIDCARRRGIVTFRLWTLSRNTRAINACMKGGFRPVCQAAHVSYTVRAKSKTDPTRDQMKPSSEKSLKWLLQSPYLNKMNGYFAYKWHFVKASRELLEVISRKGELYWDEESAFILTKPEISFGEPHSSITLLQGSLAVAVRKTKEIAKRFARVWLACYLPYNSYILSVCAREGFKRDSWGERCVVFEKRIR